jgi:hypothetical protein
LALLGVVTPDAWAQAPTPTFKINGLIDQLTTYSRNVSNIDGDVSKNDKQWYGRTRGRFDFIGEVGKAKGVLGIEIDASYGQTGSADTNIPNTAATQQFGTSGSFDLNTDVRTIVEIKWLYTEFDVPLVPVPTVARIGAQPFGAAANYKLATYANGDFAGLNLTATITPNVKVVWTYVQVEESLTGNQGGSGVSLGQVRGDDFALIVAPEITPFKGLDIKPMFSHFNAQGTTNFSARQSRGGVNASTDFVKSNGSQTGIIENRQTVGVDARWRSGPLSIDPTILYQFGNRDVVVNSNLAAPAGKTVGSVAEANIDAWLLDVRAGYQLGPLLIQALYLFTTGNKASDSTLNDVHYFQPLDTDTSYLGDWGTQLTSLGLDYLNALMEASNRIAYPGVSIGWDKYGRQQIGLKATYAVTPALSLSLGASGHWTVRDVDPNSAPVAGGGLLPPFASGNVNGSKNYVGTEIHGIASWRFAPGLAWDNGFGYMVAGSVMDTLVPGNPATRPDAKDVFIFTSRVRFTF